MKTINMGYNCYELNYINYFKASYKAVIDIWFPSKYINKLATKLKELKIVYKKNIQYAYMFKKL